MLSEISLHDSPVRLLKFNSQFNLCFSSDQSGAIEIWDPETLDLPDDGRVAFDMLSDTHYFDLVEKQTFALAASFSHDGKCLAVYGRDRKIRLFDFASGKIIKVYHSETLESLKAMQDKGHPMLHLE